MIVAEFSLIEVELLLIIAEFPLIEDEFFLIKAVLLIFFLSLFLIKAEFSLIIAENLSNSLSSLDLISGNDMNLMEFSECYEFEEILLASNIVSKSSSWSAIVSAKNKYLSRVLISSLVTFDIHQDLLPVGAQQIFNLDVHKMTLNNTKGHMSQTSTQYTPCSASVGLGK